MFGSEASGRHFGPIVMRHTQGTVGFPYNRGSIAGEAWDGLGLHAMVIRFPQQQAIVTKGRESGLES